MKVKIIILLPLFLILILPAKSQNIKLPVTNYTNKEYGRGYQENNWSIILDDRDVVYAGNANGILEYDGVMWHFIPVRQGAFVFSMAKDQAGTIYVGSQNDFGYLAPDQAGNLHYISLSDSLPEEDRFFTTIWQTWTGNDKVYFQAEETIFILEKDTIIAIYPEDSFHKSFLVNGHFYVRERHSGLKQLTDGEFEMVPGGEIFKELGVFAMLPVENTGKILLATIEKGLYLFDRDNSAHPVSPLETPNDPFLVRAGIYGGTALNDGNYAFNTLNEGIIITDREGNILHIVNQNTGLRTNEVKQIYQDRYNNIWSALNNGIARIDYSSPLSYYGEESGLIGNINVVSRHNGLIYVGTSHGLFVEKKGDQLLHVLEFEQLPDFTNEVWDLVSINRDLMIATNAGLYSLRGDSPSRISGTEAYNLLYHPEKQLLFAGGIQGLSAFQKNNSWQHVKTFGNTRADIKRICRNKNTLYDGIELWLGTNLQGAIKVIIHDDLSHEAVRYNTFDGLPSGLVLPFTLNDSVVFGTKSGLFRFFDEETIKRDLPDSLLNDPMNYRGFFTGINICKHAVTAPVYLIIEDPERIWINIDNKLGFIPHESTDTIISRPFRGIDLGRITCIYPDNQELCWVTAADGLIRYQLDYDKNFDQKFHALIREVSAKNDSLVFNGTFIAETAEGAMKRITMLQPEQFVPALSFGWNDIRFEFAAPFYDDESKTTYSYFLEGYDNDFSTWSDQYFVNYTNLHEGDYTFRIKAKNVYGQDSNIAFFNFSILPPWYRTVWAYAGYFVLFVLFVYIAIQIALIRLKRKNERLEQIVRERTAEIREQNIELERQKQEITDSIHYAQRIQTAVMPKVDAIKPKIPEYFILFKPRDIVSGDFYWLADKGNKIIIIAADCTGHGVPGAFMSMLGVSFLNKIVNEKKIYEASEILNQLRENVIVSLSQTGAEGEQKDGMDMGLCVIDFEKKNMEFAGAHNSLYMIRDDELKETKADRMPVAHYEKLDSFRSHTIELKPGDRFYMFSDGYADQFGGPDGKKFKYRTFKDLLVTIREKTMAEQKEILDRTIEEWKATPDPDGKPYEQVDDILVVGVHINGSKNND
jgi:serine phosphatase RsbU (regulator of sigma subunit)